MILRESSKQFRSGRQISHLLLFALRKVDRIRPKRFLLLSRLSLVTERMVVILRRRRSRGSRIPNGMRVCAICMSMGDVDILSPDDEMFELVMNLFRRGVENKDIVFEQKVELGLLLRSE